MDRAYSPLNGFYRHDGHILHPDVSYDLPPGMGDWMVQQGLFREVPRTSLTIPLEFIFWDPNTVKMQVVVPDVLGHNQNV